MTLNSILAAKADNGKWLPLSQHLEDTENVMEYLLEHYVAPSVYRASGLDQDSFHRLSLFVAYTHDIGKATSAFQIKMCRELSGYKEMIKNEGFSAQICGIEDKSPHALAGASILSQFFGIDDNVCDIVASHHGKPKDIGKEYNYEYQISRLTENYYTHNSKEKYIKTWMEVVNKAKSVADISDVVNVPVKAKMLITGLLVMADWIASCEEFFPIFDVYDINSKPDRALRGMDRLKLQPYHDFNLASMNPSLFHQRFGFMPNDVQNAVIDISNNMIDPGIMIIEAPMGTGKTEAALAAAEVMSCAAGTGGIFLGLPTRGTADAMFERVKAWSDILSADSNTSISLAHSTAGFNESYNSLRTNIYEEKSDGVSVNSWMTGRYRKLLPDFTVGTVDQALFTALKRKFLMLLHLGIAGKTVIIDEVHSYDDYMTEYMKSMLSWLGAYRVPVILLSATLIKEKRNEMIGAYTGGKVSEGTDSYPAVTWSDNGNIYTYSIGFKGLGKTKIYIKYAAQSDIGMILTDKLSDGGCAGVICDTVRHAQDIYECLQKILFKDYTIVLLHSRFLPGDRVRIETNVLELVGKRSKDRNKVIIVGTQVLEQSLDLDFDVLFTEKCPIDMLFQRLGRLHRHIRNGRPEKVRTPVCYILNDEDSCKGAGIYEDYIIRRTDEVVKKNDLLVVPDDIRRLTEEVYDLRLGEDGADKNEYIKRKEELKSLSKAYLLPKAEKCRFNGMLTVEHLGHDNESVRFGMNTVNLILLRKKENNYVTFSGKVIQGGVVPDAVQTKELLQNRISLRYDDELFVCETDESNEYNDDIGIWKRNIYLENEHFLIGDHEGVFIIGDHKFRYTKTEGWRREE